MNKQKIIYVHDALCGWCYGMSPVIQQLYKEHQKEYEFIVVSGGMIRGENVRPISGMADFIRQVAPRLEEITGVKLSETYHQQVLDKGTYITNSEPPAVALAILKEQFPDKQVPLAAAIQKLHFEQASDLNEVESYLPVVREFGASEEEFKQKFADPAYAAKAEKEFEVVQNWGITGFPAVITEINNKLYMVSRGFQPYEQLVDTLERVHKEAFASGM